MSFNFKNLGHYIAVAARDIVKLGTVAAPVVEASVETVSAIVMPSALPIERAAFAALGHITQVAKDMTITGTDANATVSVTLTMLQSEVADFKQLAADFEALRNHQGVKIGQ